MPTRIRIGTWNVGGLEPRSVLTFLRSVKSRCLDVLALQEFSFSPRGGDLPNYVQAADFNYAEGWPVGVSHRVHNQRIGLAILSRWPLTDVRRVLYPNPHLTVRRMMGEEWTTHDRGFLGARLELGDRQFHFGNTHFLPFHHFQSKCTDDAFTPAWRVFSELLVSASNSPIIVAGDFNTSCLSDVVPELFEREGFTALINVATRPSGDQHDNILCSRHCTTERVQVTPTNGNHYICEADVMI